MRSDTFLLAGRAAGRQQRVAVSILVERRSSSPGSTSISRGWVGVLFPSLSHRADHACDTRPDSHCT